MDDNDIHLRSLLETINYVLYKGHKPDTLTIKAVLITFCYLCYFTFKKKFLLLILLGDTRRRLVNMAAFTSKVFKPVEFSSSCKSAVTDCPRSMKKTHLTPFY